MSLSDTRRAETIRQNINWQLVLIMDLLFCMLVPTPVNVRIFCFISLQTEFCFYFGLFIGQIKTIENVTLSSGRL